MILLLTDEKWRRLTDVLATTTAGWDLLAEFEPVAMPDDRELIRMARRGDDAPVAIARARAQREAGIEAATQTRAAFNDLIRNVHGAGVPITTIARWFGVARRRIYETLESETTESAVS